MQLLLLRFAGASPWRCLSVSPSWSTISSCSNLH